MLARAHNPVEEQQNNIIKEKKKTKRKRLYGPWDGRTYTNQVMETSEIGASGTMMSK